MKRTPLRRKTSLARGTKRLQQRTPMKKVGKRTLTWQALWRKLKPAFVLAGITTCEIRYRGCWFDQGLTPAHSLKRRNATTPELLAEVVIGCLHCHRIAELLKEAEMAAVVRGIIAARKVPVVVDLTPTKPNHFAGS